MNRHVRVVAALVIGFVLGLLAGGDDAAGSPAPRVASTSQDRLPYNFGEFVVGLHERPPRTVPVEAPTSPVAPRKQARTATVPPNAVPAPVGELQALIRAGFARFGPAVAEQAVRVAGCESTGDETGARIDPNATGSQGEIGMFQLHPRWQKERAAKFGWTMHDLYDPAKNVTVAADLYAESKWSQWTCKYAA